MPPDEAFYLCVCSPSEISSVCMCRRTGDACATSPGS
ncbi:hypothetical protein [Pantoea stewartii]